MRFHLLTLNYYFFILLFKLIISGQEVTTYIHLTFLGIEPWFPFLCRTFTLASLQDHEKLLLILDSHMF